MATSASNSPTARATVATVAAASRNDGDTLMLKNIRWTESRAFGDICRPREVTDDDVGAERAQGIGAVVVVVRHRSHAPASLTQQRHHLVAHARTADSTAGTGHQDETRISHRPPPFRGRDVVLVSNRFLIITARGADRTRGPHRRDYGFARVRALTIVVPRRVRRQR